MRTLALAMTVAFAAATRNIYATDWEASVPSCEAPKLCGNRNQECKAEEICRVLPYSTIEHCQKIWEYEFCPGCEEKGMVNDPLRYCNCITPAELEEGFCEVEENKENCACPFIYAPVECTDGNEYQNACVARCEGQSICRQVQTIVNPDVCVCTREFAPVRCDSGTFNNQCEANCAGADRCRPQFGGTSSNCFCEDKYEPVKCRNGEEYDNKCMARCDGERRCEEVRQTGFSNARTRFIESIVDY